MDSNTLSIEFNTIWDPLSKYIEMRDFLSLVMVSRNVNGKTKHISTKLVEYQNKLKEKGITISLILKPKFQIYTLESLLQIDIDEIIKLKCPQRTVCHCGRKHLIDTIQIKSQKHSCADCLGEKNIVHGTDPGKYVAGSYVDCAWCKDQFYIQRAYNGTWPKCPSCRAYSKSITS